MTASCCQWWLGYGRVAWSGAGQRGDSLGWPRSRRSSTEGERDGEPMTRRKRWPVSFHLRDGRLYATVRLPFGLRRTFRLN